MYNIFGGVKSLLKLDEVCIDNNVFRLHYKATTILLVIFSLMVSSTQLIGQPIKCHSTMPGALKVIETYCWITSTFTVPSKIGRVGKDIVAPGVASFVPGEDEVKYQKYYQWVCFCLFFQAMLFYVPRYLWKIWEGGRLRKLAEDLKFASLEKDCDRDMCALRCQYFRKNLHYHNSYFLKFFLCEIFNFANVVGQIFLMDTFLGGEFSTYGTEVINFTEEDYDKRIDPMSLIFPKVTKCSFHTYGPSGTIQLHDVLCVLPLNILNEKIYIFLWFWFIILSIITGLALTYRLVTIIARPVRILLIKSRFRRACKTDVKVLCEHFYIGDWFIFYQLSKNVDPIFCKDLISQLADHLKKERSIAGQCEKQFS